MTVRLRPASVAWVAEATGVAEATVLRSPGTEQRLTAVGSLCTLLRYNSQPVLTSLAARRAAHRRRPHPQ